MPSLAEVIARAEQIAIGRGIDPHQSPVLDNGMTAEALYPHALRYVIMRDLRTGGVAHNYERAYTIVVAAGTGPLPDTVLREFLDLSYLPAFPYAAFVPYSDYIRQQMDTIVTYYSVRGSSFYCTENGNIILQTPGLPDVPANSTVDLDLEPKLADDVILAIADALSGRIGLAEIIRP